MDKYEEALERARELHGTVAAGRDFLAEIFPELRESEDERIRKALIDGVRQIRCKNGITQEQMIDWLEKQKAKERLDRMAPIYNDKESFESALEKAWKYYNESASRTVDSFEDDYIECVFSKGFREGFLYREKQKELPTNDEMLRTLRTEYEKGVADTIAKYEQKEQKFTEKQDYSDLTDLERAIHRGFLVVGVENVPVTIIKETAQDCLAWMKPAEWSEDWREEDIQTRFAFYTYKDDPSVLYLSNVFVEESSRNHGFGTRIIRAAEKVAEIIGATTISLKVKQDSPVNAWYRKNGYGYVAFEDGYDWLEKNLEYMKPNKQDWSEEDERLFDSAVWHLRNSVNNGDTEHTAGQLEDWLKSLKNRGNFLKRNSNSPSWKPSKEQMYALQTVYEYLSTSSPANIKLSDMLRSLYNDLQKRL